MTWLSLLPEAISLIGKIIQARAAGKGYETMSVSELIDIRAKNKIDKEAAKERARKRLGI